MNIVERLREYAKEYTSTTIADALIVEAADLIEQQAARIAKLEAAMPLYDELLIRCAIAEKDLAALRKRIDDAPVVLWVFNGETYPVKQCSIVTDKEFPDQVPLISKEDLK